MLRQLFRAIFPSWAGRQNRARLRHPSLRELLASTNAARSRGMRLLIQNLTPEQKAEYATYRYFHVRGQEKRRHATDISNGARLPSDQCATLSTSDSHNSRASF